MIKLTTTMDMKFGKHMTVWYSFRADLFFTSKRSSAMIMLQMGPMNKNQNPYMTVFRITRPRDMDLKIHVKFFSPHHSLPHTPNL